MRIAIAAAMIAAPALAEDATHLMHLDRVSRCAHLIAIEDASGDTPELAVAIAGGNATEYMKLCRQLVRIDAAQKAAAQKN